MFDRLSELEAELETLESQLSEIYASGDQAAARDAGRRHAELKPVVEAYNAYRATETDLSDVRKMLADEDDAEMREYLTQRARRPRKRNLHGSTREIRELLVPRDPDDGKNVIVEIRGAEGGEEANLWAGDLFHMYERYADAHRWKLEVAHRASRPTWAGSGRSPSW